MWIRVLLVVASLGLSACGPVIGDPCTVNTECGQGVCLNRDFAPGGMCSKACVVGGAACPAGSVCVDTAISRDAAGCMLTCTKDADCRTGYLCKTEGGNSICIGPAGL
jgi:hypothetical protein